ncbi:MAG: hypothetical protein OEM26_09940 [Saprospiraceae bacterium]|nr:hypothetical protein [Saprospiraceae bacterium]
MQRSGKERPEGGQLNTTRRTVKNGPLNLGNSQLILLEYDQDGMHPDLLYSQACAFFILPLQNWTKVKLGASNESI